MANPVHVTSIDALENFRAKLIVFLGKAHQAVDEVGDEIRRTRMWIENDQRMRWEGEVRRRQRVLDAAQQELLSAKLSGLRNTITAQQNAVLKAKRALEEANDKLRNVKLWNRDYGSTMDPLAKQLESMRSFLDQDMPKALAFLVQAQRTLESYTESGSAAPAPAPAAAQPSTP